MEGSIHSTFPRNIFTSAQLFLRCAYSPNIKTRDRLSLFNTKEGFELAKRTIIAYSMNRMNLVKSQPIFILIRPERKREVSYLLMLVNVNV